ncbi:MAG: hypothetical protein A2W91_19435 [Bacteroidetes bacterium GWF2_38_335]|nr:MAG: hypothetical protein A2W91_19435 [Bacteroidetes bacterium GWF2_38_335]OFY79932.1 MAG: hypothetical protein A2281_10835 [Bacteroidetes bacterium RIFOXYA12_FULL_38_20]HBS86389.1 hypothetical protein [Bacteroidales bacterium]
MIRKILITLILSGTFVVQGQSVSFLSGLNYGGPLPVEKNDSASGHPIPGIHSGFSVTFNLADKWDITTELYYSFRGVDYSQSYTKDTLVEITIMGVPGTVPSYYSAYIEGAMRLNYLDFPVMVSYRKGKMKFIGGLKTSWLFSGKDHGNVRVVVGDGGFYDDFIQAYNNFNIIRKIDFAAVAGFESELVRNISLELKVTRSFLQLYKPGSMDGKGVGDNRLYNTFLHLSLKFLLYNKIVD